MAVSLRSKAKEASSGDVENGFARLKSGSDEKGVYWILPGKSNPVRSKEEAQKYAQNMNNLISSNLDKVRATADFW